MGASLNGTRAEEEVDQPIWISPLTYSDELHSGYNTTHVFNDTQFSDDDGSLYDVPAGLIVLLSCFYGSISVVAVCGNALVIWVVATARRMQSVTNYYIANLALADIVIALFAIPFQFQAALLQRWNLPDFMCAFCPFVQVLSVNVSVFTLTAIAVERYGAVLKPLSKRPSKCVAKGIIAGIWLFSLAVATPMACALRVDMVEDPDRLNYTKPFCIPTNISDRSMTIYRMVLFFFQYLTPLCVISWVYARMAFALWGTRAPGNAQFSRDANLLKNKKRVIKMLVIVVALFAVCWLPLQTYQILQMCFPTINEYRYINIIFFCFDWLAMSNSCYNPFIYGIYNEKFKREFQQRFRYKRNAFNSSPPTESFDMERTTSFMPSRFSSFRSTADSRRYSTRPSISRTNKQSQSCFSRNKTKSAICHYSKNGLTHNTLDNSRDKTLITNLTEKPILNFSINLDDSARIHSNNSVNKGHSITFKLNRSDSNRSSESIIVSSINGHRDTNLNNIASESYDSFEDERITELYIFPNSSVIDFKDDYSNNCKEFRERKL